MDVSRTQLLFKLVAVIRRYGLARRVRYRVHTRLLTSAVAAGGKDV